MRKLLTTLVISAMLVSGCTQTLRGVGRAVGYTAEAVGAVGQGIGKDMVNMADDNDAGTAQRYGYTTVKR